MKSLGKLVLPVAIAAGVLCGAAATAEARGVDGDRASAATFRIAAAGNKGFCTAYAKRAVKAQAQNERKGCGFRGARWQPNYDRHFNWCMRVPRATAESESRGRQQQLKSCREGAAKRGNKGYCNSYATRAVKAQKQNLRNRCGLRGARWHSNYDSHFNWCMRVPRSTAESESRGRQQQLKSCK